MIVRNGHQTEELIRKGRRVDYVYRGGKRVFGYEPTARLEISNWNLVGEYGTSVLKEVKEIRFSNIVSTIDSIDGKIFDITFNSPLKVYTCIKEINNRLVIFIMSRYYGANTIFSLNGDCTQFFRWLIIENNVLKNISLQNVTNATNLFSNTNIILNEFDWDNCYYFSTCFYFYENTIDFSKIKLRGYCGSLLWASADRAINLADLDTSEITNMRLFFYTNFNLYLKDIKNWNVEKVVSIERIFARPSMSSVLEVDMSGWNLTSCTNTSNMWDYYDNHNNTCRIIKTPNRSALVDIDLGRMFYYADGSEYGTYIPANTVGSVTIYRTPPTS